MYHREIAPSFIARPVAHPDAVLATQQLGPGTNVVPGRIANTIDARDRGGRQRNGRTYVGIRAGACALEPQALRFG